MLTLLTTLKNIFVLPALKKPEQVRLFWRQAGLEFEHAANASYISIDGILFAHLVSIVAKADAKA